MSLIRPAKVSSKLFTSKAIPFYVSFFTQFSYTAKMFAGIVFSWLLAVLNALLRNFIRWKDVSIVNTFVFFVVPLLLIVAAYIAIFFAAKKSLKEHRRRSLKKVTSNFVSCHSEIDRLLL